jgi:hypothetical protein
MLTRDRTETGFELASLSAIAFCSKYSVSLVFGSYFFEIRQRFIEISQLAAQLGGAIMPVLYERGAKRVMTSSRRRMVFATSSERSTSQIFSGRLKNSTRSLCYLPMQVSGIDSQ